MKHHIPIVTILFLLFVCLLIHIFPPLVLSGIFFETVIRIKNMKHTYQQQADPQESTINYYLIPPLDTFCCALVEILLILIFSPLVLARMKIKKIEQDIKLHTLTNNIQILKNQQSTLIKYIPFTLIIFHTPLFEILFILFFPLFILVFTHFVIVHSKF